MFHIANKEQGETCLWNIAQVGNEVIIGRHSHPSLLPWVRFYVGLEPPWPLKQVSDWEGNLFSTPSSQKRWGIKLCLDISQAEDWDYLRTGLKTVCQYLNVVHHDFSQCSSSQPWQHTGPWNHLGEFKQHPELGPTSRDSDLHGLRSSLGFGILKAFLVILRCTQGWEAPPWRKRSSRISDSFIGPLVLWNFHLLLIFKSLKLGLAQTSDSGKCLEQPSYS